MKLSSVNCSKVQQNTVINNTQKNYRSNNTNNSQAVNFKGNGNFVNNLINFWQFVDNGGRALQFTVEDMTGTNIPRTIKGATAGWKYTHQINIPALLQEAIREFLTGPTMCVTPVVILGLATKASGKTANTHIENIRNLSYLMEQTKPINTKDFNSAFYETVVTDMLRNTTGKDTVEKADIDKLVDGIKNYQDIASRKQGLFSKLTSFIKSKPQENPTSGKEVNKALSSLQKTFEEIVKKDKDSYVNTDLLQAKYSIAKNATGETSFKNYVGYITGYAQDFAKKFGGDPANITKENINAFKNNWILKRLFVFLNMFLITGIFMSVIPKIYTKASGNINPNASAIYNEAKKENVKEAE